jgi:hypothetical protein
MREVLTEWIEDSCSFSVVAGFRHSEGSRAARKRGREYAVRGRQMEVAEGGGEAQGRGFEGEVVEVQWRGGGSVEEEKRGAFLIAYQLQAERRSEVLLHR